MKKPMMKIRFAENGIQTGFMSVEEFRSAFQAPTNVFLADIVSRFNEVKRNAGESVRVSIAILGIDY